MQWIVALVFVFSFTGQITHAENFQLQIRLEQYLNRHHRDIQGACCNVDCDADCLSSVRFCLLNITASLASNDNCLSGEVLFNLQDDDMTFMPGGVVGQTDSGLTVSNPLSFVVPQGSYRLLIEIRNRKEDTDLTSDPITVPGTLGTETRQRLGIDPNRRVTYFYRVVCSGNYYGLTCSTFCAPVDNITGHFVCGTNGEVICLSGYVNSSSDSAAPCTKCDPGNAAICLNNSANIDASGRNLSGGEATGIAIAILLVVAIVVVGTLVGGLTWKYQPWNKDTEISITVDTEKDALNNPIYELVGLNDRPVADQVTVSMESSPLYTSKDYSNANGRRFDVENQSLLNVLQPARSRSAEPGLIPQEGRGRGFQHSLSAMDVSANQDATGNPFVAVTFTPYRESVSQEPDYEPVRTSVHIFDNPDYDHITYD